MSIRIMSIVWDDGPQSITHKMVLLALADFANDEGWCWPSVASLCRKTALSERSVQGCIRDLEGLGWLTREIGGGTKSNKYTITPAGRAPVTPAPHAPRTTRTPAPPAPTPPQDVPVTPAPPAPKPSRTTIEPSEKKEDGASAVSEVSEIRAILCECASPSAVTSFIAYRRRVKGGGLTVTGAKRLAAHLRTIADRGGDTDDALGMAEEKSWKSVEPDWYFNAKGSKNGNGNNNGAGRSSPHNALMAGFAMAANNIKGGPGFDRN